MTVWQNWCLARNIDDKMECFTLGILDKKMMISVRREFINLFEICCNCLALLNGVKQYRKGFLYWCWKEKEWKYYFILSHLM